jgi:hypothetical protein
MNLFTDEQHLAFLRGIALAAVLYVLAKGVPWLPAPFLILHGL